MATLTCSKKIPIHRSLCEGCSTFRIRGKLFECSTCQNALFCSDCQSSSKHRHVLKEIKGNDFYEDIQVLPVPIKQISVKGISNDHIASFELCQVFVNEEREDIETSFEFPMSPDNAITKICIEIDGRMIETRVEEKEKAQNRYDDAIAQGNDAYMFNQSSESRDVYCMNVGRLSPGKSCTVRVHFITEMAHIAMNKFRFNFPTVISHRYGTESANPTPNVMLGRPEQQRSSTTIPSSVFSFEMESTFSSPITLAETNSKGVLELEWMGNTCRIRANSCPNKDLCIDFTVQKPNAEPIQNSVLFQRLPSGECAAALTMCCEVPLENSKSEIILMVDKSGSMESEEKMKYTKEAVQLILLRLMPEQKFNIIAFDSQFRKLFDSAQPFNEKNLNQAKHFIEKRLDPMGGTEMEAAFRDLFSQTPTEPRTIFLFTDGEVSNTEKIIELVAREKRYCRIFTFGVGDSPSIALVNGVASATNGSSIFIRNSDEIKDGAAKQWKLSQSGCMKNVEVQIIDGKILTEMPCQIPFLLPFQTEHLYIPFSFEGNPLSPCFTVRFEISNNPPQIVTIPFSEKDRVEGNSFSYLAARDQIRNLWRECQSLQPSDPKGKELKQTIIDLSIKTQILSPCTAFVAVETRDEKVEGTLQLRTVTSGKRCGPPGPRGLPSAQPWSLSSVNNIGSATTFENCAIEKKCSMNNGRPGDMACRGAPPSGRLFDQRDAGPPSRCLYDSRGPLQGSALDTNICEYGSVDSDDEDVEVYYDKSNKSKSKGKPIPKSAPIDLRMGASDRASRSPPTITIGGKSTEPLVELLLLQNWKGYWTFTPTLQTLVGGKSSNDIISLLTTRFGMPTSMRDSDVTCSLFVLIHLAQHFPTKKNLWEDQAQKCFDAISKTYGSTIGRDCLSKIRTTVFSC